MARFTVDTHLFRELGELLVGRDSTALIELIKNAYDADATQVIVYGEHLDSPEHGSIVVKDNGVGMTTNQFTAGFLRVASRLKDQGDRRSIHYRRRYTGVKGIGRLAAHKLARILEIDSIRADSVGSPQSLHATIDWDVIEKYETLDEIDGDVVVLDEGQAREGADPGTTLVLSSLRRAWSASERARFLADVQAFDPPPFLRGPLPQAVLSKSPLFETPLVRDVTPEGNVKPGDFQVVLDGDFAVGDEYWELVAEVAHWVLEIRAEPGEHAVRFAIAPTQKTLAENPAAREFMTEIPHPDPDQGPFFDARVLVREGATKVRQDQRVWTSRTGGIRIYLEGFRVLPYGDDDWLSIDAEYTRRRRALEMLKDLDSEIESTDPDEGLTRLPGNNYFGGVFLTQERAPTLRILVNREGFVPEAGFDILVKLLRIGVDLCTRVRAAAGYAQRQKRKEERLSERVVARPQLEIDEDESRAADERRLPDLVDESVTMIHEARSLLGEGRLDAARQAITRVERKLGDTRERVVDVISERSLLRVLASVGTQMAAFVHEINALLGTAQAVEHALERTLEDGDLTRDQRNTLRGTLAAAIDLKRGLERHASYLTDVVTPDARRRRSRQRLAERFDSAVRLVQHQAERRRITIDNRIQDAAKSPPMFAAELTTVFANLLTNAVKAAGTDGRVCASSAAGGDHISVRIQNTGAVVDLDGAERWFKPFESTTWEVDAALGQGMGLGLPITRSVLANYGATIGFVEPDGAYSTAIEVTFSQ